MRALNRTREGLAIGDKLVKGNRERSVENASIPWTPFSWDGSRSCARGSPGGHVFVLSL